MAITVNRRRKAWMGGGFVEAALASNPTANALFAGLTASGTDVFLASRSTPQFRLPVSGGKDEIAIIEKRYLLGWNSRFDTARQLFREYLTSADPFENNVMRQDTTHATSSGIQKREEYQTYLDASSPLPTPFPPTRLGSQLAAVARTIGLRNVLGIPRQVFYVTLGGFDTHSSQSVDLPEKHRELSSALSAFKQAMIEMNAWDDVTAFTMSDFGRTLSDNGNGTDHGWGSHHFVVGGGINGGQIIGDVPEPEPDSPRFTKKRARMIPTISVEQYAASLGSWFGLNDEELNGLFPNRGRFDTGAVTLFNG
ncbi:MAG: DUF1501 domain-containing protein [Gammaproteobacteria bacterium]|nr:DUF1501 domain-containing protein [Gammaproteobacteria bacterium]